MNKLFAILIMLSLSIPVIAIDEVEQVPENKESLELIQPEDIPELSKETTASESDFSEELPSPYKTPYSKKKLAKKFIIAMLCVAGCSFFLYGSLTVYNKFRDGFLSQTPTPPEGEKPLEAPNDLTEAIKTYIEKTKWS